MRAWTQSTGTAALKARVGESDLCEVHGTHRGAEASHRRDLSKHPDEPWSPVNLLWVCSAAHAWFHAKSLLADDGGWRIVRDDTPPQARPVWLAVPWPGWWLLTLNGTDGTGARQHLAEPVGDPAHLGLPTRPAVLPPGPT